MTMFELMHNILGVAFVTTVLVNVAVAYAASYLSSLFAPKSDLKMPDVSNYPIQNSMKGGPIPKIYGTRRVAGNVVWCGPAQPHEIESSVGGKNPSSGSSVTETRYTRSFLIAFCEGPADILRMWDGKTELVQGEQPHAYEGMIRDLRAVSGGNPANITWFRGSNNNGIRNLTGENYGDWPNLCCAFFENYDTGNSQAIPNITAEIASGVNDYPELFGTTAQADPGLAHVTPISDVTDLQNMSATGNYYLTGNIDASATSGWNGGAGFVPIGTSGSPFRGTLDMCGYTISNLYINRNSYAQSLLGYVGPNAAIANGILANVDITGGYYYCGALTGHVMAGDAGDVLIQNCHASGSIISTSGMGYYGGLVGTSQRIGGESSGTVSFYDCDCSVTIDQSNTTGYSYRGGFVGIAQWSWFENCFATGSLINGQAGDSGQNHGGFAGDSSNSYFYYCYASGDVEGNGAGRSYGGFIGKASLNTEIYKCYATGNVEGYQECGGFAGYIEATAANNIVRYCYSWGNATATYRAAGGFAGVAEESTIDIDNCYSIGAASAPTGVGGFIGVCGVTTQVDNCFWDTEASGNSTTSQNKGDGHITKWMKTQSNYENAGWDFNDIWFMGNGLAGNDDMNAWDIIRDIVENNRYGARQSNIFDSDYTAARDYWESEEMLISVVLDESKPWQDWVDFILSHVGGIRFNSGGKLRIGALKNETSVATLTDDDLVQPDPDSDVLPPKVNISKRPASDTFNRIEVQWTDRNNKYDNSVAIAYDAVDQSRTGTVRKKIVKLDGICNGTLAKKIAMRFLIDGLYRFSIYKFSVTFKNSLLENNDVVSLSDNFLLTDEKIRIMNIAEDRNGRDLAITAMDDYAELYPDVTGYGTQDSQYTAAPAVSLADMQVNFLEDYDAPRLYLSCVPGNESVNGGFIYKSYDDVNYSLLGRFVISDIESDAVNSQGTIQGSLPAHNSVSWSPKESVRVDIGTLTDLRTNVTDEEFWNNRYIARIGSEIIAFKLAEETATPGIWRISNLRRGLFGTEPVAHYSGEAFCTLIPNFVYNYADKDIGKTVYFKVMAYYGINIQSISDVSSFSVTIEGHYQRPAAASLLRLSADENDGGAGEYSSSPFTLYWNLGSRSSGFNYGDWLNLPWNNYIADSELQAIVLRFEQPDGTLIGERSIAVANSETIDKANDLGGLDEAVIKVIPRRALRSRLENSILVHSV
jgi:hypothetical protein